MPNTSLPEDFLLGTATSSVQIEGGDTGNTWYKWCQEGHIKDGSSCFTANDHWNRVEEDIRLLVGLNVQIHRMSLEWSRIEPSPGKYSQQAVEHYRNEIGLLIKNGIKPLITLHHFSEPLWFIEKGGWKIPGNLQFFLGYVRHVVDKLGDMVSDWVTFNEPNAYTELGYLIGIYPPGEASLRSCFKVQAAIIKAHAEAYELIHKIRKASQFSGITMVGTAMNIRIFDGLTLPGKVIAKILDYIINELLMEGTITGKALFPLNLWSPGQKAGKYADFIGINYYTRNIVEFSLNPLNWFHNLVNDITLDKADNGWDIYPPGIYRACRKYYNRYKLPVFITENGLSDRLDNKRARFIYDHLENLIRAINDGIPVKRYYHWTLMDNFEWLEGQTEHFGLYECDFNYQERKPRNSAEFYSNICKHKTL